MTTFKVCLILLIIYSVIFFNKLKFNNEVVFSGDAWQYQSLAVNWVKGFGLMKMGAVAGDYHQDYKFNQEVADQYIPQFNFFLENGKNGGYYSFYRTPGYPVFMGTVYKIFGINPERVKQTQLLMIIMIAAFLPYIGWHYWQKSGFLAGLMGGLSYLKEYARIIPRDYAISYPGDIMVEPLIAFSLFCFVLMFIYWQKNKSPQRAFILGLISAISLLVKGTNIFIPLLILIYLGYEKIKNRLPRWNFFAYLLGVILIMLPWSAYASAAAQKPIILSTQSADVLLDNNNEFATDGGWHPEGYSARKDNDYSVKKNFETGAFYSRPEIKTLSLPAKLLAFFLAYPKMIPGMLLAKIKLGFGGFTFLTLAVILMGFKVINQLTRSRIIVFGSILVTGWLIYLWQHPLLFNISRPPIRIDLLLLGLVVLLIFFRIIFKKYFNLNLPAPFLILFFNYLLLAIITCGWPRLNQVLDFLFRLIFFKYLFEFIITFYQKSVKIINHAK